MNFQDNSFEARGEPSRATPLAVCPAPPERAEEENLRRINRILEYMDQHLEQPLTVSELAAQAGISTSHFFALFKRHTGRAPIGYFICLRMHHARKLLAKTSLSVKEVAAALGYDDQFYFSRLFKAVNEFAPSEYRARFGDARRAKASPNLDTFPAKGRRPQDTRVGMKPCCATTH